MHCVYILRSIKDKTLYIGYTENIHQRLKEHNEGRETSTKRKRPVEIIYSEIYKNRKDATQREKYLKTGWGRNYVKRALHNTLAEI